MAAAPSFTSPGPEPDVPHWVELSEAIKKAAEGDASGFAGEVWSWQQSRGGALIRSVAVMGEGSVTCTDARAGGAEDEPRLEIPVIGQG
ncbi:hypothetical protein [Nonomuraea sp. KM90]|uniref:hypothetical protein n=1 Tax=Nonomuraea sp. KM90 TaxID=3457428 RepID=UPI003FCEB6CA